MKHHFIRLGNEIFTFNFSTQRTTKKKRKQKPFSYSTSILKSGFSIEFFHSLQQKLLGTRRTPVKGQKTSVIPTKFLLRHLQKLPSNLSDKQHPVVAFNSPSNGKRLTIHTNEWNSQSGCSDFITMRKSLAYEGKGHAYGSLFSTGSHEKCAMTIAIWSILVWLGPTENVMENVLKHCDLRCH